MKLISSQRHKKNAFWELNPLVMSANKLDFNNTTNVEGEWFINKNLDLAYRSVLASDSVPSDTSTDVDSDSFPIIDALTSLHAPLKSSLMVHKKSSDMCRHKSPSL